KPANTVTWERTEAIAKALDAELADADRDVRVAVLKRMQREKVPTRPEALAAWLQEETNSARVAAILTSLREQPIESTRASLVRLVLQKTQTPANRRSALALLDTSKDDAQLLKLASAVEDGPVLADALHRLSSHPKTPAETLIV